MSIPSSSVPLRWLLRILLSSYLLVYPGSVTLVALDRVPDWGQGMGSLLLALAGAIMACWLLLNYGRRGLLAIVLLLLLAWLLEHIGSTTGIPFGRYHYTETLQPQLPGGVPVTIPLAWIMVIPSVVGLVGLFQRATPVFWRLIVAAATWAMLLDMLIEPVAFHITHYWVWDEMGAYYGVPLQNFLAWWFAGALLAMLHIRICTNTSTKLEWPWLPLLVYLLHLVLFLLVNLTHGYYTSALIGCAMLVALMWQGREHRLLLMRHVVSLWQTKQQ